METRARDNIGTKERGIHFVEMSVGIREEKTIPD